MVTMITRSSLYSSQLLTRRAPSRAFWHLRPAPLVPTLHYQRHIPQSARAYVTKTEADSVVEELQELYATARDEFEIAAEETEKKTVYAADDRAAAKEELEKLKAAFVNAVNSSTPEVAIEIRARVGQRIRELESGVQRIEEMALQD